MRVRTHFLFSNIINVKVNMKTASHCCCVSILITVYRPLALILLSSIFYLLLEAVFFFWYTYLFVVFDLFHWFLT